MQNCVLILLIVFLVGCQDEPIDSKASPREYRWTIDTIAYPGSNQTIMRSIWGSSSNDLYVVGHNDRGFGQMFHYDGIKWSPVNLGFGSIDLENVYGFSPNEIWAVGEKLFITGLEDPYLIDSSLIIRFDGVKWSEYKVGKGRRLKSLWGNSNKDVWFGGSNGTLFHFDGTQIYEDSILNYSYHAGKNKYSFTSFSGNDINDIYSLLSIEQTNGIYRYSIFWKQNNAWTVLEDSSYEVKSSIWRSPDGSLISTGFNTLRFNKINWEIFLQEDSIISTSVHGNNKNNIFLVGYSNYSSTKSEILHYNGSNWYRFNNLLINDLIPNDVIVFPDKVFITCVTLNFPQKTLILRGEL